MSPRKSLPPSPAALAVLAVAFALPGLAGHDPWKSHDALGLGIVWDMLSSGDAIVPRVAGRLWLADPPLYHWFAATFGKIFGLVMPLLEAARLASGAFMLAALWLIRIAARDWALGEERSALTSAGALLLLLGSVGLMVHAHEALPELAALASLCGALAVLPHAARRPLPAGVLFGAALGFAFLSSLWIAPVALFLSVLLGHAVCAEWRTRKAAPFLIASVITFLVLSSSWPLALYLRSPQAFGDWWQMAARPYDTPLSNLRSFVGIASWFTWPAWPLAFWAVWALRRRLADPRVFVPAVASLLVFAGLVWHGPAQDVNLTPLLAPFVLLAAQGIPTLRRGAAAALDWFGVITFAFFAGLVWLGYVAMITGYPPRVAANFERAAPGFTAHFQALPLAVAIALTAGWFYLVLFSPPSALRSVSRWAAGMVLLWGTFSMLWMPWADYQKSYRTVAEALRAKIPPGSGCIAERSLGLPQAAALEYHAGLETVPFDPKRPHACRLLLVQGSAGTEAEAPGPGWVKIAEVGRPGDRFERERLYRLAR